MPEDRETVVRGWVEILHYKGKIKDLSRVPEYFRSLNNFLQDDYEIVGSPLPLHEYYSLIEIYSQFAKPVDPEFRIKRPFAPFDALNVCANDDNHPDIGKRIETMMLIPKGLCTHFLPPGGRMQYHQDLPLQMINRPTPFRSFLRPNFTAQQQVDQNDEDYEDDDDYDLY